MSFDIVSRSTRQSGFRFDSEPIFKTKGERIMNDYTYDEAMQNYDLWKDEYDENGLNVYSFGAVVNGLFEYCKRIRFENDSEPYERLNFITESYNNGFTTLEETLEAIVKYGKEADAQSNMPDWA